MKKKKSVFTNSLTPRQKIINGIFLTIIFMIMFIPFWNVVVMSTSTAADASAFGMKLWWKEFSLEGYKYIFDIVKLGRPLFNSIFVSLAGTTIQMILSAMAGYVLVQKEIPFKKVIVSFVMLTMMIPGDLTLVSIYQLNTKLHLTNSYTGLILNGLVSGFSILLMRNYFLSVPYSLSESARIDGASEVRIFRQIYLPLALPGLATVFFLEFVARWNAIMIPATIITEEKFFTLPLILKYLIIATRNSTSGAPPAPENAIMAAIAISTIPLVLLYIFAQKFLLSGMTLGASKE